MSKTNPLPSQDFLKAMFSYRSGELFYKASRGRRPAGSVAGTLDKNGYVDIRINQVHFKRHRLIWMWHYGNDPGHLSIDHINNTPGDDRIENLQLLNHRQNITKGRSRCRADRLPTGVVRSQSLKNPFMSRIQINGKREHLGSFPTPEEAAVAYEQALSQFEQTQP